MSSAPELEKTVSLAAYGNIVPEDYSYYQKEVTPGEDLVTSAAYLKWYDIYPADTPFTPEQTAECRAFVTAEVERLKLAQELGFVLFHRAGTYLLLMIITWRNTNELWESVYYKQAGETADYRLNTFENTHRGTYCVWELGPIWHERHAWVRFLSSPRDEAAKRAYINDRFSGRV